MLSFVIIAIIIIAVIQLALHVYTHCKIGDFTTKALFHRLKGILKDHLVVLGFYIAIFIIIELFQIIIVFIEDVIKKMNKDYIKP